MFLRHRPIRLNDLPEGLSHIRDRFAFSASECPALLKMWRELIVSKAANTALIEDVTRAPGHRFLQFAIVVFLSPEFASYLKTEAPPLIARLMLHEWQAGRRPWLSLDQIRTANSREGVSWAFLHSGPSAETLHGAEWPLIAAKITDHAPLALCGYRTRECFLETYSPVEAAYAEEYGLDLCRMQPAEVPGQAAVCARLYHLTQERAMQRVGAASALLFQHDAPRFFFSPAEQELLLWALSGETDEELSSALDIALVTVKKRWQGIYERVADVSFELLAADSGTAKRGREKKRRLLSYLRQHMEELRPVKKPTGGRRPMA